MGSRIDTAFNVMELVGVEGEVTGLSPELTKQDVRVNGNTTRIRGKKLRLRDVITVTEVKVINTKGLNRLIIAFNTSYVKITSSYLTYNVKYDLLLLLINSTLNHV
jgi:hypothetical protein